MRSRATAIVCASALVALLTIVAGAALADGLSFLPAVSHSTGASPCFIAAGDVNKDGKLDLVTANNTADSVSVLLGSGSGGFGAAQSFGTGPYPSGVAVADFNGDGAQDVAVSNSFSDTVSVLLASGSGGLGAKTDYPAGAMPSAIAAGDMNGDGFQDLVVTNEFADTVSVMLGGGAGTFGAKADYPTGDDPYALAVADINGDGQLDVITVSPTSDTISVLLGSGGGALGAAATYATGADPSAVAVGDLDGNGSKDLVVANSDANTVSVFLNSGGSFSSHADFACGESPNAVVVADLDSNGKADVATADSVAGTVSVLLGDGAGGLGAPAAFGVGADPLALVAGALNDDASVDLATADFAADSVSVLLQPTVTHTITPSVLGGLSGHGTISPSTPQTVSAGATPTFSFTPDSGYHVAEVTVDGAAVTLTATNQYTFPAVTADHTITAEFAAGDITITPSVVGGASGHGTVSPSKAQIVSSGATPTFTFTPEAGYHVSELTVDGAAVTLTGPNAYTFPAVTASHKISVKFAEGTLVITPSVAGGAGGHGTVSPSTPQTVAAGATPTFTFTPDAGYYLGTVTVDGTAVTLTLPTSYAFPAVMASHTVEGTFAFGTPSPTPSPSPSPTTSPTSSASPSPSVSPSPSPTPTPTAGPITTAAPFPATVKSGADAVFKFRVNQAGGGVADVTILIKDKTGKVVSRKMVKSAPMNTLQSLRFTCRLKKGAYRFYVSAATPSGATSTNTASNRLTVK